MRSQRESKHEAEPREEDRVATGIAVARGRGEDVDQVGGGPLARHRELDEVVEEARDGADRHQVAGPSLPDQKDHHGCHADADLQVASRVVDGVEDVGHRAPGKRLDEGRDRYVEGQQRLGGHQVGVHREQDRDGHDQRQQPRARAFARIAGQDLLGRFPDGGRLAHFGSSTFNALTSAVMVAGV